MPESTTAGLEDRRSRSDAESFSVFAASTSQSQQHSDHEPGAYRQQDRAHRMLLYIEGDLLPRAVDGVLDAFARFVHAGAEDGVCLTNRIHATLLCHGSVG